MHLHRICLGKNGVWVPKAQKKSRVSGQAKQNVLVRIISGACGYKIGDYHYENKRIRYRGAAVAARKKRQQELRAYATLKSKG